MKLLDVPIFEYPPRLFGSESNPFVSFRIVFNGANRQLATCFRIWWDGDDASKTLSAAGGGKIGWRTYTSSNIFADAGTTLRIGLQDRAATSNGEPDGSWDVYADLVGGTDTIANNTWYETPMESGSKTISKLDDIAVVASMESRGGSDQIYMGVWSSTGFSEDATPLQTRGFENTGTGWSTGRTENIVTYFVFDDGTYGFPIYGASAFRTASNVSITSATTPDEIGNYFIVPFVCRCVGVKAYISLSLNNAEFDLCLYEDPLGSSPVLIDSIPVKINWINVGHGRLFLPSRHVLYPWKTYGITIRPTNTTLLPVTYLDVYKSQLPFTDSNIDPDSLYAISRVDNAGAFADYNGGTAKSRKVLIQPLIDGIGVGYGQSGFNLGV